MSTNAIIFTRSTDMMIKLAMCSRHCLELDYEAIAIVRGDWGDAIDYLVTGQAEVIVVAEDDDLPPDRTPRIEVVSHMRNAMADLYRRGRNERSEDPDDSRRRRPRPLA